MNDMQLTGPVPERDQNYVHKLAASVADGQTEPVRQLFSQRGCATPFFAWNPSPQDINHPLIRTFATHCKSVIGDDGRILADDFDTLDLSCLKDWLMVVDVLPCGTDFRYHTYGAEIAAIYGRNLTGDNTSAIGGHIATYFMAIYRAMTVRGEPILSRHEPPPKVFTRTWTRLLYPLFDRNGDVVRIAGLNVPDSDLRAGLEVLPDPVFVLHPNLEIFFANNAATSLFGERSFVQTPITFQDYCGFPLDLSEAVRKQGLAARHTTKAAVGDTMVVHFEVTTKVIYYRDTQLYLAIVKPQ